MNEDVKWNNIPTVVRKAYEFTRVTRAAYRDKATIQITLVTAVKAIWVFKDGRWQFDHLEG